MFTVSAQCVSSSSGSHCYLALFFRGGCLWAVLLGCGSVSWRGNVSLRHKSQTWRCLYPQLLVPKCQLYQFWCYSCSSHCLQRNISRAFPWVRLWQYVSWINTVEFTVWVSHKQIKMHDTVCEWRMKRVNQSETLSCGPMPAHISPPPTGVTALHHLQPVTSPPQNTHNSLKSLVCSIRSETLK